MTSAVLILAAGKSERFGSIKALYPVGIRTSLEKDTFLNLQIRKLEQAGFNKIFIVLGYNAQEISRHLPDKIKFIINSNPEHGQFSSIQAGLKEVLKTDISKIFVLPIDVPAPEPEVWKDLLSKNENRDIVRPKYQGKLGHPILISRSFAEFLLHQNATNSESRLDFFIRDCAKNICDVDVKDKCVVLNLNTPDEMKKFLLNDGS